MQSTENIAMMKGFLVFTKGYSRRRRDPVKPSAL